VLGRFCEQKEDIQCGEVFSHTPDHIVSNNTPAAVRTNDNCVCTEVFIRHPSLSLSIRTQSGSEPHEYQEYEKKALKWKGSGFWENLF
jgi:hypothetical protein